MDETVPFPERGQLSDALDALRSAVREVEREQGYRELLARRETAEGDTGMALHRQREVAVYAEQAIGLRQVRRWLELTWLDMEQARRAEASS